MEDVAAPTRSDRIDLTRIVAVREFEAFAGSGKENGVIAHHIASAEGVQADLFGGALAGDALSPVASDIAELPTPDLGEDFGQGGGGPAGGVLLQPMMHFDDLEIVARAENLGSPAGQPEQDIHPGRKVRGPHDRNLRLAICNLGSFLLGVAGGADHQGLAQSRAMAGHLRRDLVKTEIEGNLAGRNRGGQILSLIDRGRDLHAFRDCGGLLHRATHPALGPDESQTGHGRG